MRCFARTHLHTAAYDSTAGKGNSAYGPVEFRLECEGDKGSGIKEIRSTEVRGGRGLHMRMLLTSNI